MPKYDDFELDIQNSKIKDLTTVKAIATNAGAACFSGYDACKSDTLKTNCA